MGWMKSGRRALKKVGRMNPFKSGFKGKKDAVKSLTSGEAPDYRSMAAGQSVTDAKSAF